MLNRLFVIIGFLVILAIGGAFVVPRFIQWSDYRERLETMGTQALGADVAITGDISLTLLPQPRLALGQVRVGPEDAPLMQVGKVEAEFSLLDFLSDRYRVTRLQLDDPVVALSVAPDGTVTSGLTLAEKTEQSNISIADADLVNGLVQVTDARSGKTYAAEGINGHLRLEALKGPFNFQGTGRLDGVEYTARLSTGRLDDTGVTTLGLSLADAGRTFSLDANGTLEAGSLPRFAGDLTFRRPPPESQEAEAADIGRGDLVLEGKIEAAADRVLLKDYTLLPDENRAAIRLTGAAELHLGEGMAFNAIVSGGVVSLPPRDATKELTDPPYEMVRLLAETPLPFIPGIPGTIGLDITELDLRGMSLRDLRLDASTDTNSWTIDNFAATLPGSTSVGLTGNLSVVDGHPIFAGGVTLASKQLDRLAALWRKPPADNPLFGEEASLVADVALSSDSLSLSAGTLVVAGINQGFDATIRFAQPRELSLKAAFTTLGTEESNAIAALLPDVTGSGSFGATFPKGSIDVSASRATLFGQQGSDLAVAAQWEGGVLELSRVHAGDLGGAQVDAKLTAFGTLAAPELSGQGNVSISDGAPITGALLGAIRTPPAVVDFIARSLPASLTFQLDPPTGDGEQKLSAQGRLGTADTQITAALGEGIAKALTAPLQATIQMQSGSPALMGAQLGLGPTPLFDDRTPLQFTASFDGVPSNSYEVHALLKGGEDHISFDGNVVPGDFTSISGAGTVEARLADPGALAESLGAGGIYIPAIDGRARLQFSGRDSLRLSEIEAEGVTGELAMTRRDGASGFTGTIAIDRLDAAGLLPILAGASATIPGAGFWPQGPISIGDEPRSSTGRIDVKVGTVTGGGRVIVDDASLGFDWDAQSVHLRNLTGRSGAGTLIFDAEVCCSNAALPAKQIKGRLALEGVDLDGILPEALAAQVDGKVDASAQFEGTGASPAEIAEGLSGNGSYSVTDFSAVDFDPGMFDGLSELDDVVDMDLPALEAAIEARLGAGPFEANMFTGSFTIAGGVVRSPNLAIAGNGGRVFGSGSLGLDTLSLDARYAMSPTVIAASDKLLDNANAEVAAVITGPVWAPVTAYDVSELADGMKIRASEIELARLEQLRLEDEARRKAAADERARVAAEQAAAEAARQAAEQEAARKAAEQEEARKAAEAAAASVPPPPMDLGL